MLKFEHVRWRNFLSTGNIWTEIDLAVNQTTLIVGENGAGKSTLLDALSFALFGRPHRKINKPQLVNTINKKDCVVEVTFSTNGSSYRVIRGLKPAVFEIYKDGDLVDQNALSRDYQEYLEKTIVKMNHKSFPQIIAIGSASYTPFLELTAANRREFIEDLLDLQMFSKMNVLLKDRITTNIQALETNQKDRQFSERLVQVYSSTIKSLQEKSENTINEKKERLESIKRELLEQENNITKSNEDIEAIKPLVKNEKILLNKLSEIEQISNQLKGRQKTIEGQIKFFDQHSDCPTCRQNITEQFKTNTVEQKNLELKNIADALLQLETKQQNTTDQLNIIREHNKTISELKVKIAVSQTMVENYRKYIDETEAEINQAVETQSTSSEETQLIQERDKLDKLIETYRELEDEKNTLGIAQSILNDKGIKATIIRQYIPIINKLINKYLASLEFFINFEMNEHFEETIKSRFRDEFSYTSFSQGEKMRINLALLFAWRAVAKMRNSVNTNLLIMDEIFDSSLDTGGTEEFIKIMQTLKEGNVFVITHKTDQFYDRFNNVIRFKKVKNFSEMIG
jgi:DNA repair exonuclease SbcCD ATPase subunit